MLSPMQRSCRGVCPLKMAVSRPSSPTGWALVGCSQPCTPALCMRIKLLARAPPRIQQATTTAGILILIQASQPTATLFGGVCCATIKLGLVVATSGRGSSLGGSSRGEIASSRPPIRKLFPLPLVGLTPTRSRHMLRLKGIISRVRDGETRPAYL